MPIRLLSDLHLEFHRDGGRAFIAELTAAPDEILVLAGDIAVGEGLLRALPSFCRKWREVVYVAGNHEYYQNEMLGPTQNKAARDEYLGAAMGHELDETFDIQGVRFLSINTVQGETWSASNGLAAEVSDAQLAWLRVQLSAGLPTVLMMHHPPTSESRTPTGDSLCQAIQDHPGVIKAI